MTSPTPQLISPTSSTSTSNSPPNHLLPSIPPEKVSEEDFFSEKWFEMETAEEEPEVKVEVEEEEKPYISSREMRLAAEEWGRKERVLEQERWTTGRDAWITKLLDEAKLPPLAKRVARQLIYEEEVRARRQLFLVGKELRTRKDIEVEEEMDRITDDIILEVAESHQILTLLQNQTVPSARAIAASLLGPSYLNTLYAEFLERGMELKEEMADVRTIERWTFEKLLDTMMAVAVGREEEADRRLLRVVWEAWWAVGEEVLGGFWEGIERDGERGFVEGVGSEEEVLEVRSKGEDKISEVEMHETLFVRLG